MVLFGNALSCLFASMALGGRFTLAERLPMVVVMWLLLVPVAHQLAAPEQARCA